MSPQEISDPTKVTNVMEQLSDLFVDISKETYKNNDEENEPKVRFLLPSLDPLRTSTIPINRDAKLDLDLRVGFAGSRKGDSIRSQDSLIKDIQSDNRATWQGSSEHEASKDLVMDEGRAKSVPKTTITDVNRKDATTHLYVSDAKDALKEKYGKGSMQVGLDVAARQMNADKTAASRLIVDNRAKRKRTYIRLCKKVSGTQKRKDCVSFPTSNFYVDQDGKTKKRSQRDTVAELQRQNTENGSYEQKQRDGAVSGSS